MLIHTSICLLFLSLILLHLLVLSTVSLLLFPPCLCFILSSLKTGFSFTKFTQQPHKASKFPFSHYAVIPNTLRNNLIELTWVIYGQCSVVICREVYILNIFLKGEYTLSYFLTFTIFIVTMS